MISVLKFGGSSVATTEKIEAIASYLQKRSAKGEKLIVVVSAMGKTTDGLLGLAHALSSNPDRRELDQLLSVGEQTTIALMAIALQRMGLKARSFTGVQAGIQTTGVHTKSQVERVKTEKLKQAFNDLDIAVVAGFQGINEFGDITTLGRGGSDTTAVALAAAFKSKAEIYTDVNGVYRTDPRVYPDAKKVDIISYEEMMEMSALGAKVMEMRSVELGKKYGVPIYVGKTLSDGGGTWIMSSNESMEKRTISAATLNENILSVSVQGISGDYQDVVRIFQVMGKYHINIDMITLSDSEETPHLTFTIPLSEKNVFEEATEELKKLFPDIKFQIFDCYSKLSVVGLGMRDATGVAAGVLSVFEDHQIPFYQITTSEISISFTVPQERAKEAVAKICEKYDL